MALITFAIVAGIATGSAWKAISLTLLVIVLFGD